MNALRILGDSPSEKIKLRIIVAGIVIVRHPDTRPYIFYIFEVTYLHFRDKYLVLVIARLITYDGAQFIYNVSVYRHLEFCSSADSADHPPAGGGAAIEALFQSLTYKELIFPYAGAFVLGLDKDTGCAGIGIRLHRYQPDLCSLSGHPIRRLSQFRSHR